jgi:hypothetical protein
MSGIPVELREEGPATSAAHTPDPLAALAILAQPQASTQPEIDAEPVEEIYIGGSDADFDRAENGSGDPSPRLAIDEEDEEELDELDDDEDDFEDDDEFEDDFDEDFDDDEDDDDEFEEGFDEDED